MGGGGGGDPISAGNLDEGRLHIFRKPRWGDPISAENLDGDPIYAGNLEGGIPYPKET